jgi:DNA-binding GntR family transcriptional regulator
VTVRQTLDMLGGKALISRTAGRSTYAWQPTVGGDCLTSFIKDMRVRGLERSSHVIGGLLPAPPQIEDRLRIELGEDISAMQTVRAVAFTQREERTGS